MTKNIKKRISFLLSTLFYAGYFPKAPGTMASLLSLPVIFLICYGFGLTGLIIVSVVGFIFGLSAVKQVLLYTEHDPSFVVIDEFVGQSVTFLFVADILKHNSGLWWIYVAGFILFRFFDISKPYPASYADKKINNAFGVMLDDVIAGLYASVALFAVKIIFL